MNLNRKRAKKLHTTKIKISPIVVEGKCAEIHLISEKLIYYCTLCLETKFSNFFHLEEHLFSCHNFRKIYELLELENSETASAVDVVAEPLCKVEPDLDFENKVNTEWNFENDSKDAVLPELTQILEEDCNKIEIKDDDHRRTTEEIINKTNEKINSEQTKLKKRQRTFKTIEIDGIIRFQCETCPKYFNSKKNLRTHERIHNGDWKEHPCDYCEKICKTARLLREHTRTHTGERPYKCEICGKDSPTKSALINHKIIHTGKRKFECKYCDAKFYSKGYLIIHERIHTGEKPFVCDSCGLNFASLNRLVDHKKSHLPEKPRNYTCEICKNSFYTNQTLKRHMKVHSDERNFVCVFCNAAYKGKKELVQHEKIHLGTNEYSCNICGMAFPRYSRVRDHIRFQHGPDLNIRSNLTYTPADETEAKKKKLIKVVASES